MTKEEELFDKWAKLFGKVFILTNKQADELLAEMVKDFGRKDTGVRPRECSGRKLWQDPKTKREDL